ncbi:MAG: radical SAM family heme chaperone HemW [Lachnospiraceae bacterium]|nr:radical SAM family heme chaperone HemW [Lachnospiraceae bacterium]
MAIKDNVHNELEIYIHIPFCVRKCLYCDFLSAPATDEIKDLYMRALFKEIESRADEYRKFPVSSVFIGGGTPSAVKPEYIVFLMKLLNEKFILRKDAEVTIEVNPASADELSMHEYRMSGINRISIGLQSANADELKALGRMHDYGQFLETYDSAVSAGFENINVDLMSGIPEQSIDSLRDTLFRVTRLVPEPKHISAYSLIVEEGTPFYDMYKRGELNIPDEDCDREMYEETVRLLREAGYERYEISNYAKEGFRCRHNCGYWQRRDYIGFGTGAASLHKNKRFKNCSDIGRYIENPCGCREEEILLSVEDCMEEFMFLGLRMADGVAYDEFKNTFGRDMDEVYGEVIRRNISDGLLCEKNENIKTGMGRRRIFLTDRGIDVSNYVLAQFLFE